MAVAYKASAVVNSGSSTTSSITVSAPAGLDQDDYLFLVVAYTGGTGVSITVPSGWGWQLISRSDTGTTYGVQIYRRHAGAGEPTGFNVGISPAQYASVMSVAYSGLRMNGAGGAFFPQSGVSVVDGTGATTGSHSFIPLSFPYFGTRFVVSYGTGGAVSVTGAGAGLTTRADTTTTSGAFIELALTDSLTGAGSLTGVPVPAATLSGAASNNKSLATFLRQDQALVTSPQIDSGNMAFYNAATSGGVNLSPSLGSEQALLAFHVNAAGGSITSVTTPGCVWRKVGSIQNPSNTTRVELWTTTLPTTVNNYTASWTASGPVTLDIAILNFAATGSIVNYSATSADSGSPSASITTTGPNSRVYGFISDDNGFLSTITSPNAAYYEYAYAAGSGSARMLWQLVPTSGSTVTSGTTLSASGAWSMIAVEVSAPKSTGSMLHFF